jgi:hypothetical protein
MDFMKLLKSMEELLYEIMTWLVFYPRTLWLSLRHPLRMMDYSTNELTQQVDDQYTDTVSPPLFLIISLIIAHGIEIGVRGQSELVRKQDGLDALITDDTNLIALRAIAYAIFPLIASLRFLRVTKTPLTRETMRLPFYSHCYLAAPYALILGLISLMPVKAPEWLQISGAIAIVVAVVFYVAIETLWFRHHADLTRVRAFGHALRAYVESLILIAILFYFF